MSLRDLPFKPVGGQPAFEPAELEEVTQRFFREAESAGAKDEAGVVGHVVKALKDKTLKFAIEDPDAPECWPRVWFIWRGNALMSSAKGHEYFLRHYLGTHSNTVAPETAKGVTSCGMLFDFVRQGLLVIF